MIISTPLNTVVATTALAMTNVSMPDTSPGVPVPVHQTAFMPNAHLEPRVFIAGPTNNLSYITITTTNDTWGKWAPIPVHQTLMIAPARLEPRPLVSDTTRSRSTGTVVITLSHPTDAMPASASTLGDGLVQPRDVTPTKNANTDCMPASTSTPRGGVFHPRDIITTTNHTGDLMPANTSTPGVALLHRRDTDPSMTSRTAWITVASSKWDTYLATLPRPNKTVTPPATPEETTRDDQGRPFCADAIGTRPWNLGNCLLKPWIMDEFKKASCVEGPYSKWKDRGYVSIPHRYRFYVDLPEGWYCIGHIDHMSNSTTH